MPEPVAEALGRALALGAEPESLRRRQAIVSVVNADTIDVTLAGIVIPGVRYLRSYAPVLGDRVWVDLNGTDPLVIGASGIGTGIARVTSSTRPPTPYQDQLIQETDTDRLLMWNGSAWVRGPWFSATGRTGFRLRRAAAQTIATGTVTSISWDTEDEDTDGFFAPTATTATVPAGLGGIYGIYLAWSYTAGSNVRVFTDVVMGGVNRGRIDATDSAGESIYSGFVWFPIAAADTIRLDTFQASGADRSLTATLVVYRLGT